MSEHDILRKILIEIDRDPAISQKSLSEKVGLSVGTINWHVKRCVNKGLVKMQKAPLRRYLYYLTPEGFTEKAKLTASYLQASFDIFRTGREQYGAFFEVCRANGWTQLALLGKSELTELALLMAPQYPELKFLGIIDAETALSDYNGIPVIDNPARFTEKTGVGKIDAAIACQFMLGESGADPLDETLTHLNLDRSRLLIPALLQ